MKTFFIIVKSDYLQRTRSYSFLIVLCLSLAIAYTFVPAPNANYFTVRIDNYVGYYNSAWFGYVTAMMSSILLSLVGFFLINGSIKFDRDTGVGQIISTTKIHNFSYLFSKVLTNYLVLLTIVLGIFVMSVVLFFLYNEGFAFEPHKFVKPYIVILLPSMFFIASLAVLFEVVFAKYPVIQSFGFFFLFAFLMLFSPKTQNQFGLDVFGNKIVTDHLEESIMNISNSNEVKMIVGYISKRDNEIIKFNFNGLNFPTSFFISRIVWILLGIGMIFLINLFFHRFDKKQQKTTKNNTVKSETKYGTLTLSELSIPETNFGILPLLKVEFLLLLRGGNKWLWILNGMGMILLLLPPIHISHQFVLPILWFMNVSKLSNLTIKDIINNTHYFTYTSYKPLGRLLFSQLLAGVILLVIQALPLLVRFGMTFNYTPIFTIVLGAFFIVILASWLGIVSKGKKLFEVLFFMITYAIISGLPFVDYFGGLEHYKWYVIKLMIAVLSLGVLVFMTRLNQLNKT